MKSLSTLSFRQLAGVWLGLLLLTGTPQAQEVRSPVFDAAAAAQLLTFQHRPCWLDVPLDLVAGDAPDSVTGTLPNGLTLTDDLHISGVATQLGVFKFSLTATNAGGSATAEMTLKVVAPPTQWAVQSGDGRVRVLVTVAANGKFTAKAVVNGLSKSVVGTALPTAEGQTVPLTSFFPTEPEFAFHAQLKPDGSAIGLLNRPSTGYSTTLEGWANVWLGANVARTYAGDYTMALKAGPHDGALTSNVEVAGGFARMKIVGGGACVFTGISPTGLPLLSASFISPTGRVGLSIMMPRPRLPLEVLGGFAQIDISDMAHRPVEGDLAMTVGGASGFHCLLEGGHYARPAGLPEGFTVKASNGAAGLQSYSYDSSGALSDATRYAAGHFTLESSGRITPYVPTGGGSITVFAPSRVSATHLMLTGELRGTALFLSGATTNRYEPPKPWRGVLAWSRARQSMIGAGYFEGLVSYTDQGARPRSLLRAAVLVEPL